MDIGVIVMFHGAIADIPATYQLCDGTNGTPDLRNRFVVGAGDTYDPGDNANAQPHNHDLTMNTHFHTINSGTTIGGAVAKREISDSVASTGITSSNSYVPPYYALCFIQKVG